MKKSLLFLPIILGIIVLISVPSITAQSESNEIPSWIKSIASAWGNNQLTDTEFTEALEFLIENEVIVLPNYQRIIPSISESTVSTDTEIDNNTEIEIETMMVESEIQVSTDKTSYISGENISISGSIETLEEYAQSVVIVIIDPNGGVADIAQVMPESDGSYSHVTSSNAITIEGEYQIRVQYGSYKTTTNFNFA